MSNNQSDREILIDRSIRRRRRVSSSPSGIAYRHLDATGRLTADFNVKKAHRVRHVYVVRFVAREWKSVEARFERGRFSFVGCTRGMVCMGN